MTRNAEMNWDDYCVCLIFCRTRLVVLEIRICVSTQRARQQRGAWHTDRYALSLTAAAPTCVYRSADQTEHFICQNTLLPARKCAVMRYDSARLGMKLIMHEERRVVGPCEWISSYSLACVGLSCGFCLPCRPSLMSSEMFLMFWGGLFCLLSLFTPYVRLLISAMERIQKGGNCLVENSPAPLPLTGNCVFDLSHRAGSSGHRMWGITPS